MAKLGGKWFLLERNDWKEWIVREVDSSWVESFVTWWLWEGETNEDIDLALFNLRVWKMCEKVREAVVFY